jgi:hypothetical protein
VCIIDDREDVWNFAPNLVHVKPYHFFQHTGDINAPPGLAKCENDDKEGFSFTKVSGDQHTFAWGFKVLVLLKFSWSYVVGLKSVLTHTHIFVV